MYAEILRIEAVKVQIAAARGESFQKSQNRNPSLVIVIKSGECHPEATGLLPMSKYFYVEHTTYIVSCMLGYLDVTFTILACSLVLRHSRLGM